jgi:glycosyltransferase involved in cell wall biosynthesis
MRIVINTYGTIKNTNRDYRNFVSESFRRIVKDQPEHEFIFISDKYVNQDAIVTENSIRVLLGSPGNNPISWKWWYDIKIPALLKKYKADLFVSCDGCCSLTTKVPQCLFINDLSFLSFPEFVKKSHLLFFKRYVPKFLQKAKSIVVVSEFIKNELVKNYGTAFEKLICVNSAPAEIFKAIRNTEKKLTKERLTEGKEYFLYAGPIRADNNLINLLKAFSIFKKTQQSSMKLVLAGEIIKDDKSVSENLKTYKYRNDIVILPEVSESELVKIMGAAYALINPNFYDGFGILAIEAMLAEIPVLTSENTAAKEIAKDAALYLNPSIISDIAAQMMTLYKDEELRKKLIEKGKLISEKQGWDKTVKLLWQSIEKSFE